MRTRCLRPLLFFCGIASLAVMVSASLQGCGSCFGSKGTSGDPASQTPHSPRGARNQSPVSPRASRSQTPQAPGALAVPAVEPAVLPETPELSIQTAGDIKPGMTYEDIHSILGSPGVVIAGTDQDNVVYRWSYAGMSFMGRFENGILVRKTAVQNDDEYRGLQDEDIVSFDKVLYEKIQPGMSYDEVLAIIGMDAQPLTSNSGPVKIYKWTDERGSSITGRFENSILKRKSGMILEPGKGEGEIEVEPSPPAGAVHEDKEPARISEKESVSTYEEQEESTAEVSSSDTEGTPAQEKPSRVSVSGSSRRSRTQGSEAGARASERSYHPKVKLPEFKRRLREGVYEIRIHNTTQSNLKVALISEEGGLEMRLAPGRNSSAKVGQGTYQVYFINENDPFTLHQGQSIPVAALLSDFSVYLFEDTYEVDFLDRNAPRSGNRR